MSELRIAGIVLVALLPAVLAAVLMLERNRPQRAYRRALKRFTKATRKMQIQFGQRLVPVLKRATEQIGELAKQLEPLRRTDT